MVKPKVLFAVLTVLPFTSGKWTNGRSVHVPLGSWFNNKAFGASPGEASLNILNESYPADPVGVDGVYQSTDTGISYLFPGYNPDKSAKDNVICAGQTVDVDPSDSYFAASMLLVSDTRSTTVSGNVTLLYTDNTTSTAEVRAHAFWWFLAIRRGEITFPYFFTHNDTNHNASHIYERSVILEPGKRLQGIVLPDTTNTTTGRLHLFSLSLWETKTAGLQIQHVRPTQNTDGHGRQLVEVVVDHAGSGCISNMAVAIESRGIKTPTPAIVKRLCSGDQKRILVAVKGTASGATVKVSLKARKQPLIEASFDNSSTKHPEWYDGAKFGIFIHWGPYSVPGWGNSTPYESYAEWFWWYSTRVKEHAAADRSGFNAYRLRTFGPDLNYDDFLRTTRLPSCEKYQPHLKRGTYFSLPEWFNPDWGKYGFTQFDRVTSTSHPGIIARNPYTGKNEPYTGRLPIGDFIDDLMVPQMKTLAYEYDTDIMWCDAGASNGTDVFAAEWFNWARSQGRQVAINDRCGSPWAADFDTPEYATFSVAQTRKWESNQGMDPFSYGFNRATNADEYMNATTLVHNLVDIVSKNGNLLLNVGPRPDGTIHQKMMDHLREAGTWINRHGAAIFNTTYWYVTPEEVDLRFTQTNDAFYILSLKEPAQGSMSIQSKVPIVAGDKITALGMDKERDVEWSISDAGQLTIEVTKEMVAADKFCWVFQIKYSSRC
ncbi:hypothetical protein ACCO45_007671 [Purpureocillium lilacinum]|uniref:Uncharacterized protein n=1 Tax=Purpureocillium lilacinum TaxID=33203 RepID=A0ACC4DM74_PURLI